jgi:uncharacterized protein (DUF1684 family)
MDQPVINTKGKMQNAGMRLTRIPRLAFCNLHFAFCISVAFAACTSPQPADDPADYISELSAARTQKDAAFRGSESPVPPSRANEFLPLDYYPVDPAYRVPGGLRLAEQRTPVEMPTSTGQMRQMELVGTLEFTLQGQPLSLGAFVEAGQPPARLFVPFADLTSGTETYPAGRYLDLDRTATGFYVIDFNRAYNPYCYYNPTYECPYPPPSNRLKIAVKAGEKAKVEAGGSR